MKPKIFVKKYSIHLMIVILSLVMRLSTITTGNSNFDSCINDIAIGMFASSIVALLIKYNDDKRWRKKAKALRLQIFLPILKQIGRYMFIFCQYAAFLPKEYRNHRDTFDYWTAFYCDRLTDNDFERISNKEFCQIYHDLNDSVSYLIEGNVWLQTESIIEEKDFEFAEKLKPILAQDEIFTITDSIDANVIRQINKEMKCLISDFEITKPLAEYKYGYDYRLDSFIDYYIIQMSNKS